MVDGYLSFPNRASFESREREIFAALGYTAKVQRETKTTRYADPIKHPTRATVLMTIKEVAAHNPMRKESPNENILTNIEKLDTKSRIEWEAEGYFPPVISTLTT